jgi:hypothetical protein
MAVHKAEETVRYLHVRIDTAHDPEAMISLQHIVKVESTHQEDLVKVTFTSGDPIYVKASLAWFKAQLEQHSGGFGGEATTVHAGRA